MINMPLFSIAVWLLLGLLLGGLLLAYARGQGRRIEKRVLLRGLIVVALIYLLFALITGNLEWIAIELLGIPVYGIFCWLALRHSLYWLAAGWALHPLWDALLHLRGAGSFIVPEWYAVSCISFDLLVASYIMWMVHKRL